MNPGAKIRAALGERGNRTVEGQTAERGELDLDTREGRNRHGLRWRGGYERSCPRTSLLGRAATDAQKHEGEKVGS